MVFGDFWKSIRKLRNKPPRDLVELSLDSFPLLSGSLGTWICSSSETVFSFAIFEGPLVVFGTPIFCFLVGGPFSCSDSNFLNGSWIELKFLKTKIMNWKPLSKIIETNKQTNVRTSKKKHKVHTREVKCNETRNTKKFKQGLVWINCVCKPPTGGAALFLELSFSVFFEVVVVVVVVMVGVAFVWSLLSSNF